MASALEKLVAKPDMFREEWPAEPVVLKSPTNMADLFSREDARQVIREPALQAREMGMLRNGAHTGVRLNADHPTDTLALNGLHLTWPPLAAFAKALSAEFGHQVTANVYLTPPRSRGYGPHWDTHHVFLAQTEGSKYWRLNKPVFADPLERHRWTTIGFTDEQRKAVTDGPPDFHVTLRAGEVLFIPRGWVHHGATTTEHSLHITLGVQLLTVHWLMGRVLDTLADDAGFRKALPPTLSAVDFEALVTHAAEMFASWMPESDPGALGQSVWSAQQVAALGLK